MTDCNPCLTPSNQSEKLRDGTTSEKKNRPCRELIGSLMYLSDATRPDISHTVHTLAQHCENLRFGIEIPEICNTNTAKN